MWLCCKNHLLGRIMKKIFKQMALLLFVSVVISGCATIMDGKQQSVTFNSIPSGADVYLNGKHLGKTPLNITIDKPKENGQLKFSKEGYKTLEMTVNKKMSSWLLGNIIFGGTFGTTTDYASGALYEYDPHSIQVTLEANGMSQTEKTHFMAENQLRRFILTNFSELSVDLANKKGEFLNGLFTQIHVDGAESSQVVADLQNHLTTVGNAPEFSTYVIKTYL